jgi:two-component system sensor histidine kinase/response regulator
VEDNEINREVVVGLLEDDGLRIDQAENGQRAVQMVEASDYDLVLMDMQMPVLDGVAATKAIRANPRFALLPIIAMTANVMAADREKCHEAGMNDHIPKPIDPDQLRDALLRWIRPTTAPAPAARASGSLISQAVARPDSLLISGIATADGLRRAGGNRKRYESLLSLFADSQADSISAIRAALASNDSATAHRLAHSLKGASANLGATALAESAGKVEAAIQSNQSASDILEALSKSLDATTAAIRSALAAESRPPTAVDGDPAAVAQQLARLKKLLESDDGDASDFVLDARPQLAKVLTPAELDGLVVQVGNFAYADALQSLSGIAARLSLTLE